MTSERCLSGIGASAEMRALDRGAEVLWGAAATDEDRSLHQQIYHIVLAGLYRGIWGSAWPQL